MRGTAILGSAVGPPSVKCGQSLGDALASGVPSRRRAGIELTALITGVLAIMWIVPFMPSPRTGYAVLLAFLIVLLVYCRWWEQTGWRALGFRLDNFLPVLGRLSPFLAALVVVLVSIGAVAGTLRFGSRFWSMLETVPPWALLQQYLLLGFAHRRLRVLLGPGRRCVLSTAALFGVMHVPNPPLTIVCALGGLVWAREYDRSPNLFAHALTHTIASAILANSLPYGLLKNMSVGYRYFGS